MVDSFFTGPLMSQYRFLAEHVLLLMIKQIIVCQPPKPQSTLQMHNEQSGHLDSAPNKATWTYKPPAKESFCLHDIPGQLRLASVLEESRQITGTLIYDERTWPLGRRSVLIWFLPMTYLEGSLYCSVSCSIKTTDKENPLALFCHLPAATKRPMAQLSLLNAFSQSSLSLVSAASRTCDQPLLKF